jgi:hypothetical protein
MASKNGIQRRHLKNWIIARNRHRKMVSENGIRKQHWKTASSMTLENDVGKLSGKAKSENESENDC